MQQHLPTRRHPPNSGGKHRNQFPPPAELPFYFRMLPKEAETEYFLKLF
jgi:hypothetical protein